MSKTTIIIIILSIFGFIGFAWWGNSHQKPLQENPSSKSALVASQEVYDFGTISMKNGDVNKDFTITNPTDKDILISTITTSCSCTTAFIIGPNGKKKGPFGMAGMDYMESANETIKAGQSDIIQVVYNPNAHGPAGVGLINRTIFLTEDSGAQLQLEIKALVTP